MVLNLEDPYQCVMILEQQEEWHDRTQVLDQLYDNKNVGFLEIMIEDGQIYQLYHLSMDLLLLLLMDSQE